MNTIVTGSDLYNHPICDRCWFARNPRLAPVRLGNGDGDHSRVRCCFCGEATMSGIFVRMDPWELPKHTEHRT